MYEKKKKTNLLNLKIHVQLSLSIRQNEQKVHLSAMWKEKSRPLHRQLNKQLFGKPFCGTMRQRSKMRIPLSAKKSRLFK